MATITVTTFWNMDSRKWTSDLLGTTEQGPLAGLVQGDIVKFAVRFVQGGVAVALTAPVFTASGIKALNDFTGGYLIQLSAPVLSETTLYTFTVSPLNSAQLNTFLQTYRNTWCALELYDSANGILTTPLELQITPGYSLSGTPTDNVDGVIVVAAGKTVTFPLTLTFPSAAGTNGQQLTLSNSTTGLLEWAASGISGITVGTTTANGTAGHVLYTDGSLVQAYAISGTGSVAMTASPSFTGTLNAEAATFTGAVATTSNSGTIATNGATATIATNGVTAHIYTGGDTADIFAAGNNASVYAAGSGGSVRADGVNGFIQTRGTFKLSGSAYITTLSHAATADRAIAFPDATGTIALTSDITGGTQEGSFTTLEGTSSATLGTNGGTGGSVVLRGSTSGSATINVSATGGLQLGTPTSLVLTNATGILRGLAAQETVASYNGVTLTGTMYFADETARANGTLTGIGTLFTTEAKVGDRIATASDGSFGVQAGPFFVKSIASNTSLTLTRSGNAAQIGSGNAVSAKIFRSILTAQSAAGLNLVTISADGTFILGTPPTSLASGAFAAAAADATFNYVYLAGNRLYSSGGWRSIETYGGSANVDIGLSESGTTRVHILSVASTLAVTGAATLTGVLTANGGITVIGGSYLLTTNSALTDHTGSNTATIGSSTNAPIPGDPTKWIAIDDNGTTRYIPTWG